MKKIISFIILLSLFIIGFFHNSMMAFAMQNNMHETMMQNMWMNCSMDMKKEWCKHSCHAFPKVENKLIFSHHEYRETIISIKITQYLDIFSELSYFQENKSLIKNTSPPNLERTIKNYSYSQFIGIIQLNI